MLDFDGDLIFLEAQPLNTRRCLSVRLPACLPVLQLPLKTTLTVPLYDLVVLVMMDMEF